MKNIFVFTFFRHLKNPLSFFAISPKTYVAHLYMITGLLMQWRCAAGNATKHPHIGLKTAYEPTICQLSR